MALRLIEIVLPEQYMESIQNVLEDHPSSDFWYDRISKGKILVRVLLPSEETEEMVDLLNKRFSTADGFRIILIPIEASVPRANQFSGAGDQEKLLPKKNHKRRIKRISREELYEDIADTTDLSRVYIVMVVLSSIVAAIGILQNNVAVIIGAMVIAPLLGPNVATSLATTIGDTDLLRNALKANVVGVAIALLLSVSLGILLSVDPAIPEIASRTRIGLGDLILALAAGSAGALAFTTGIPTTLVGVMVAVALLPPLVTFGLLIGSGQRTMAVGALLLFLTNIICVNLSGVITFLAQKIVPSSYYEAERARRATRMAIVFWLISLSLLTLLIAVSQGN